ncbi:hypothetical protein F4778DRAFT_269176 [Xylariomycetidae sp. FL2044]|nr:hypothetical protein F4778DRAFT_269176 [Xylariomycetidae sp. FL2044]
MAEMILPKGIVFNRSQVYAEIAKYDIVPLDKILGACHVYTTTANKLSDPTARRLENFWTRLLGGDRRYLPGAVIAKLYQDISEGVAFVKLRGPSNRYEPPSPERSLPESLPKESAKAPDTSEQSTPAKGKAAKASISSSAKVPHPILKKPRGPSASGPRPTARFVSPPQSDADEDDSKYGEFTSSGSVAPTHKAESKGAGNSSGKDDKRKSGAGTSKKKATTFVASSTASRRRPAMPRRPSSQSSTAGSEGGAKEGSSLGLKYTSSQGSTPMIAERLGSEVHPGTKSTGERLSAKAAGKRPATQQTTPEPTPSGPSNKEVLSTQDRPLVVREKAKTKNSKSVTEDTNTRSIHESGRTTVPETTSAHRPGDVQERGFSEITSPARRSRADTDSRRPGSRGLTRGTQPPQAFVSPSTTGVTTDTVIGTIVEFNHNPSASETSRNAEPQEEPEPEDREAPARAAFTPTPPSPTPTVPLGRSKSQLTLLLERKGGARR